MMIMGLCVAVGVLVIIVLIVLVKVSSGSEGSDAKGSTEMARQQNPFRQS